MPQAPHDKRTNAPSKAKRTNALPNYSPPVSLNRTVDSMTSPVFKVFPRP